MQSDSSTKGIAARWRSIRRLYPIYLAISSSFQVGPPPPYDSFAGVTEEQEPDAIERAELWMTDMDAHIQPFHLRQVMQQTDVAATEPKLLALVQRHASKSNRSQLDSDKLNFVMTQYLWACAPPSFRSREISVFDASEVLEPVLGPAPTEFAPWLKPLQEALDQLRMCDSVTGLKEGGFVERGRELRSQVGSRYFERSSLLLFAYYNFCLRQAFVRGIAADARRIYEGLDQLRKSNAGIQIKISTSPAPLSIEDVQQRVTEITSHSVGEYGVDESWKEIPELRVAVETAVADSRNSSMRVTEERVAQLGDTLQKLLEQINGVRNELAGLRGNAGTAPQQQAPAPAPAIAPPPEADFDLPMDIAAPEIQDAADEAPQPPPPPPPKPAAAPPRAPVAAPAPAAAAAPPTPTPAAPAPAAAGGIPGDAAAELAKQLNHLRSVLSSAKTATGLVPIGNTAIVLSSGEIEAVLKGNDKAAQLIRQGTAVRMCLVEKLELAKSGQQQDFRSLRQAADQVQGSINALLKESPRPPADALSITARQLAAVLRAVPRQ